MNGWKPDLGQRRTWRLEHENRGKRTGLPSWLISTDTRKNHMTVLSQTPQGYAMLWELETPSGNSDLERLYARAMGIYGVDRMVIGTNAAGMPMQLYGGEAIRERLATLIKHNAQADPETLGWLQDLLKRSERDPLFEVFSLADVAVLIGRLQRAGAWDATAGMRVSLPQKAMVMGEPVQGPVQMRVESIDPKARKVSISWVWDFPKDAHPASVQQQIDAEITKGEKMAPALPGPDLAEATSFRSRYSGKADIAADSGAVLKAEEVRELRMGLESMIFITRVTRE